MNSFMRGCAIGLVIAGTLGAGLIHASHPPIEYVWTGIVVCAIYAVSGALLLIAMKGEG